MGLILIYFKNLMIILYEKIVHNEYMACAYFFISENSV